MAANDRDNGNTGATPQARLDPTAPEFQQRKVLTTADDSIPPTSTQYVLAWDIEKSGPRTDKHSMLAIGACVLQVRDGKLVSTFRVFMRMEPGHDFSEVCRQEYWFNWEKFPMNKEVLQKIEAEGVDAKEGIHQFAAWLDKQEAYWPNLVLATDNPASDAAWVSHYFQKYLDRNPMIHPFGDETRYRRLHHSNAFARALSLDDGSGGSWTQRLKDAGVDVPPDDLHDHDPLNDAKWIARLYCGCLRYVQSLRSIVNRHDHRSGRVLRYTIQHGRIVSDPRNGPAPPGIVLRASSDGGASTIPFWLRDMNAKQREQQQQALSQSV
jgi:hypothetical protein